MSSTKTNDNTLMVKINQTNLKISIRVMLPKHVDDAIDCFYDQYDGFDCSSTVSAFFHLDPESFFVAVLDKGPESTTNSKEKVIGVCGCPLGPQKTHFLGLYGVHPEFRKYGIGPILFELCMNRARELDRNIGLYAVANMKQKYIDKWSFNIRENVSMVHLMGYPECPKFEQNVIGIDFIQITNGNLEKLKDKIIKYDSKIHEESRPELLKFILHYPQYKTCVAMNAQQEILGYGCLRQHSQTKRCYLGPLYSNSIEIAQNLAELLMDGMQVKTLGLILNGLDSNPFSLNLASKFNLKEHGRSERLFTRNVIKANHRLIYSVFSPDFSL